MIRSVIAAFMMIYAVVYNEPLYAVTAGLFEIASVIYTVTRPRRLVVKEASNNG